MRQRAVLLSGVRVPVCPALQKSAALTLPYRVNYTDKTNQTCGQSVIPGAVSGAFFRRIKKPTAGAVGMRTVD